MPAHSLRLRKEEEEDMCATADIFQCRAGGCNRITMVTIKSLSECPSVYVAAPGEPWRSHC